jgi:hypothetical protein
LDAVAAVRNPAGCADSHWRNAKRLLHDAIEGVVIVIVPESAHPPNAAIDHMKRHPTGRHSCGSWHFEILPQPPIFFNLCARPLYFLPLLLTSFRARNRRRIPGGEVVDELIVNRRSRW